MMLDTETIRTEVMATAFKSPGKGVRTTEHLNLTRSLADVGWPGPDHPAKANEYYPVGRVRPYESHDPRFRFAGAE